ncbi:Lipopolysaccharide export system ATP-binding protein LptB [Sulfitobacter sp. THAF37]|uniref:ABC transporter ATP-binding protein n=1 Tax=Sulfitobacter sp. THAF37 TaxID=2587855 RepID=UPI0012A932E2|nr:ATP-binding cassette domain-containing protein [Sulfitobacter sp. THAF37]QFT57941.1 Lipopolysaccharide export system ATP-binding protein LptB [Sulfitobacter sp. THAF37]
MTARPMALMATEDVSRQFGSVCAVDQISIELNADESVGLIGPNGAGKTTLLSLLSGALKPSSGRITMDGNDVTALPVHARVAAGIAKAAQIPQTFDRLTVRENVLLPAYFGAGLSQPDAGVWIDEVLEMTGLIDRADKVPASLGLLDRKRLELAKAVASKPRVLLLDEIAAGLTEPEIALMKEVVRRLQPGRAIVWVEHIPFALQDICARLVVMDKGARLLDGPFDEVWASDALQSTYMGM